MDFSRTSGRTAMVMGSTETTSQPDAALRFGCWTLAPDPLMVVRTMPEAVDTLGACVSLAAPLTTAEPMASEMFSDWMEAAEPDATTEPDARATFFPCVDVDEPATRTLPDAAETFAACVLAPEPEMPLPIEPEAFETFGACTLEAVPLTTMEPLAELAFFCCVDEIEPETSAAPDDADVFAD